MVCELRSVQERLQGCNYAMAHPEDGVLVPACAQHSVYDPLENAALRQLLPLIVVAPGGAGSAQTGIDDPDPGRRQRRMKTILPCAPEAAPRVVLAAVNGGSGGGRGLTARKDVPIGGGRR